MGIFVRQAFGFRLPAFAFQAFGLRGPKSILRLRLSASRCRLPGLPRLSESALIPICLKGQSAYVGLFYQSWLKPQSFAHSQIAAGRGISSWPHGSSARFTSTKSHRYAVVTMGPLGSCRKCPCRPSRHRRKPDSGSRKLVAGSLMPEARSQKPKAALVVTAESRKTEAESQIPEA